MFWNKRLMKLCIFMPTSPKICATTTLGNLKIEPSTQYVLMNYWIATTTTGSYCLKNHRTCSRPKSHHLYTICSKCPPRALPRSRMSTNWNDASRTSGQIWITLFLLNVRLATWLQRLPACVRAYNVKMAWLTTRLTIFEPVVFVVVRWFIEM